MLLDEGQALGRGCKVRAEVPSYNRAEGDQLSPSIHQGKIQESPQANVPMSLENQVALLRQPGTALLVSNLSVLQTSQTQRSESF
jgi:hypothetical protein